MRNSRPPILPPPHRAATRTDRLSILELDSRQLDDRPIFRDAMRIYPEDARESLQHVEGYPYCKDDFIKDTDKKAAGECKSSIGG